MWERAELRTRHEGHLARPGPGEAASPRSGTQTRTVWYTFARLARSAHPNSRSTPMSTPPHWDLTNVYPSLESREYQAAVKDYRAQVASLGRFFDTRLSKAGPKTPVTKLAALIGEAV